MFEVAIGKKKADAAGANSHLEQFFGELVQWRKQRARLYYTYVKVDGDAQFTDARVVFVTTSKDIHLGLGLMKAEDQYHLARFLQEKFTESRGNQLLLSVEKAENEEGERILITRTLEKGESWWHETLTLATA